MKPGGRVVTHDAQKKKPNTTTTTKHLQVEETEALSFHTYVHLLTCKALAGPNIRPSYNPSVNRLWSFGQRRGGVAERRDPRSTSHAAGGRGGSARFVNGAAWRLHA